MGYTIIDLIPYCGKIAFSVFSLFQATPYREVLKWHVSVTGCYMVIKTMFMKTTQWQRQCSQWDVKGTSEGPVGGTPA